MKCFDSLKYPVLLTLFALLMQSCGTLQKCRYSRGWNLSFETRQDKKESPLKLQANKANKILIASSSNLSESTYQYQNIRDSFKNTPTNDFKNILKSRGSGIHKNLEQVATENDSLPLKVSHKGDKMVQADYRQDNLGMVAFAFIVLAAVLLSYTLLAALPLFGFFGSIGVFLLTVGRLLLYARFFDFRNGQRSLYKNKGFGLAAWILSLIITSVFVLLLISGFFL